MLENTGKMTEKVPNTLALVASRMALEQTKEFRERAREAAEKAREAERADAHERATRAGDAVEINFSKAVKAGGANDSGSSGSGGSGRPFSAPSAQSNGVDLQA